ncbi:hypothetical protein QQM79_14530 [Marinobacteraceae bacterium S3BR75-40.1]
MNNTATNTVIDPPVSARAARFGCLLLATWLLTMSAVAVGHHNGSLDDVRAWLGTPQPGMLYAEK